MKRIALFSIYMLTFFATAQAANWYVATTGLNTNPGTLASPFLTIQKAADVAVSGDIVYVRAGVYREMVDLKANGVTCQPYGSETVTINGTDLLTAWTLTSGSTYQTTMSWDVDAAWAPTSFLRMEK